MKYSVWFLVSAFLCSFFFVESANAQSQASRVEILDFHNEHRCNTCLEIERLTKKVLQDYYADAVKSKKISFRLLNADDKANEALVKKFFAYGTTLVVYSVREGKESHEDLTNFAFLNYNKPDKFNAKLLETIDAALRNVYP